MVFGNRLLRIMYVPKKEAGRGDWGKLRNGNASSLVLLGRHYSTEQNKEDEVGGACRMQGGEQRWIQGFIEKSKRQLGRP